MGRPVRIGGRVVPGRWLLSAWCVLASAAALLAQTGPPPYALTGQAYGSITLPSPGTLTVGALAITQTSFFVGNLLLASTAPTISSAFGTSPSIVANGTSSIRVNVGTGGVATAGVLGYPTATTGWNCAVNNLTAAAAHRADNTRQTASTTATVTIENQTTSTGAAVAWTASDIVIVKCVAY